MEKDLIYWTGGHERWIHHPSNQLPEMPLVMDASNNAFCSYIKQCEASTNDKVYFCNSSCYYASSNKTMAHALAVEATKVEILLFEIGERLFYLNEGHTLVVRLQDILEGDGAMKFVVDLPGNKTVTTTCDNLKSPCQPDNARVPITSDDYRNDATELSNKQLEQLANPQALSPEQQELMS